MLECLVNCFPKAYGQILGFHWIWEPRLMCWVSSSMNHEMLNKWSSTHILACNGAQTARQLLLEDSWRISPFSIEGEFFMDRYLSKCRKIEYKNCKYTLVDIWACRSGLSTASQTPTDTASWRKSIFFTDRQDSLTSCKSKYNQLPRGIISPRFIQFLDWNWAVEGQRPQ